MSSVDELAFPAEIFDLFLDNLHDDPAAIRVCSLVCTRWMIRTRRHLFHTVDLHLGNIATFLKLFQTPTTSTLIPAIRHLRYSCPKITRGTDYSLRPRRIYLPTQGACNARTIQPAIFTEILGRLPPLPGVVSVVLKNTTFEPGPTGYLGNVFPNLVELKTLGMSFQSFERGNAFRIPEMPLARKSSLKEQIALSLCSSASAAGDSGPPSAVKASEAAWTPAKGWAHLPSSLQTLTMQSSGYTSDSIAFFLYLWMSVHPTPPALQRVDLHCDTPSALAEALGIIQDFGDELIEVTIQGQCDWIGPTAGSSLVSDSRLVPVLL